jgi:hypothetical protein
MNLKAQRNLPAANPQAIATNAPVDKELAIGIKVEHEHTQDDALAAKIASDHLREDPAYYSKLMAAGLVDEPEAQALVAQTGNTTPHVETRPLIATPQAPTHGNFIDATRKTRPLGSDSIEHFGSQIAQTLTGTVPSGIPTAIISLGAMACEGGAKITEPNAGITSDQKGKRWSIDAYPTDKKATPPMR